MLDLSKIDIPKAAALFVNNQGQLLITKDHGSNIWTIPGGTMTDGESPVECLRREMLEELAVKIEVNPKMYKKSPVFAAANDPGKTVQLSYYFCKFLGDPKPTTEIELLHWFSKVEFESEAFALSEANKKFLLPALIADGILF